MKSRAKEFLERAKREAQGVVDPDTLGLSGLEALSQFLDGDSEAALSALVGKTDPQSIRTRLAILVRLKRFEDASRSIANLPPHDRWCDLAVAAMVGNGETAKADEIIEWAAKQADPMLRRKCLLMYADVGFARALHNRSVGASVPPGSISVDERRDLEDVDRRLDPLIQNILAAGDIHTRFDELAALIGLRLSYLLARWERVDVIGSVMVRRRPVPMESARAVLGGMIEASPEFVEKLRQDHAASFEAALLAALIESDRLRKYEAGFQAAFSLISLAKSTADRERLYFALFELSQRVKPEYRKQLETVAPDLLAHNVRLLALARAGLSLRAGDLDASRKALDESRDESDPRWLQLHASVLVQTGEVGMAIAALKKATLQLPHPDLHRAIAELAYGGGQLAEAKESLESLLALDPRDVPARRNLAAIEAQLGDFPSAAEQFQLLSAQFPNSHFYRINHAICLARSNALEESLAVYDQVCAFPDPTVEAIAGRAQVLRALGRIGEAFQSLAARREQFWDDARYVLAYMDLGYAAGQEERAHEAFLRLQALHGEGKVPEGTMQQFSLDEMVELLGHERKRHDMAHQDLLQGKMPWLLVDTSLRRGAYWGWRLRTQKMDWIGDDPVNRAGYCIYATNGFAPQSDEDGKKRLDLIECPPMGPVVADLSALITLHRLDLLDLAANRFGQILIPTAYLSYALDEASKLVLHQRSQRTSAEQVRDAINAGRITVGTNVSIPLVNEHTVDTDVNASEYYRLRDVAAGLTGRIPDTQLARLGGVAHHPARSDVTHPKLLEGISVRFGRSTLETLASLDLLEPVLALYRVEISPEDRDDTMATVRGLLVQDEVRQWQQDLWRRIRSDHRFVQIAHAPVLSGEGDEGRQELELAFAAALLGQERGISLLADDRMLQASAVGDRPKLPCPAFGSDALIIGLRDSKLITPETAADKLMALMRWRYRFVVPDAATMKALATKFKSALPGKDLQEMALYVHDCMRDPGLFAGAEATEPPMPMAIKLYQAWAVNIAEFLVDIWTDEVSYSEADAKQLTEWAIAELLPSPPRNAHDRLQTSTAAVTARAVLGRAMIRSASATNVDRASSALRAIASAMYLSEDDYLEIVTGVIDAADFD